MINYKYALIETEAPATEPLDLATVKTYLRIDQSSDDSLLESLIVSARTICELMTGLNLINRKYSLYIDRWGDGELYLPSSPIQEVITVNIYKDDDSVSVFDAKNYYVDNKNQKAPRIVLRNYSVTPIPTRVANGIEIQYVSGFGADATCVPELLKQAMLQVIAHLYENRGDSINNAIKVSGARELFRVYRKTGV